MKTIIGFDSWIAGARHFERLVPAFEEKGYRLMLIHIGSWGHDKNRPKEELIGRLLVRDIKYYNNQSFYKILEAEDPSAVLFLSTRAFAHMAFNRYAHHLGIPTCHLYHGLVNVQAVGGGQKAYKVNPLRQLAIVKERIAKNIFRLIPIYMGALIKTNAPLYVWREFFREVLAKAFRAGQTTRMLTDTATDRGCVYTKADITHMHQNYGIPRERIRDVGNPDLMSFGLKKMDMLAVLQRSECSKDIFYIDTALIEVGACFKHPDEFIDHIKYTHTSLAEMGYHLVVKLHPAHNKSDVPLKLEKLGIELCSSADLVERLKRATAVITEPSTAAMIPALLGLPIFLCQYGRLKNQAYGNVLTSYPRAQAITNMEYLAKALQEETIRISINNINHWVKNNAGPLPIEDMPSRVADEVIAMI